LKSAILLVVLPAVMLAQQGVGPPTFPAPAVGVSSIGLRQTFANYWEWRLAVEPELATRVGRDEYNDRWRDWSKSARDRARASREEFLRQVQYVAVGNLTSAEHLSADLLEYELRTELDAERVLHLVTRVSQSDGLHNDVFSTIDQMPARSVRDYGNIVARIRALPVYVDQSIELMSEQLAAGLAQPSVVVDLMLEQVAAQAGASPDSSPLLAAFETFPPGIGESDRARLRAEATAAFTGRFVPSWRRLEAFLHDTYRPQARVGLGIGTLPDGPDAYASLIRSYTTTRLEPSEIHQLGLREVARLDGEMARLIRQAGFSGTPAEFEQRLRNDEAQRFTGQDEMLQFARDVLSRLEPQIPVLFLRQPRTRVGVRPIPPDREASTASNYTAGTPDGSRPAWFNMNTYRPAEQSKYTIEALVLHETVPGHHLQVGLARELEDVPEFRRVFRAGSFTEGWALYAESLGSDLGVYQDPASRFGQLASEKFRAVRLVVDTGLHAMGWSRDEARAYFAEHAPSQSLAEIDRYIARPAQALAYKIGELRIRDLRRRAEQQLGPRFDLREFHDAVLRNGALPLDLLEQQIDAYLDPTRAPPLR
jgi:uncharacterized protein (DUF885 family)